MIGIGGLTMLVSGIWLMILAFKKHILWGLAYIFVPFASLVFVCMNWDRAGKPFLISLVAVGLYLGGFFTNPSLMKAMQDGAAEGARAGAPAAETSTR